MAVVLSRKGGGSGGGGAPSGPAGGVLSGTYPNPGFAVDMATQAELNAASVWSHATGEYYQAPGFDYAVHSTPNTLNQEWCVAFPISRNETITSLNVQVFSAVATSLLRLGIRLDNGGIPGTLLLDAGTVSCATTGVKSVAISQAVTPGLIWITATGQTAAPELYTMITVDNVLQAYRGLNPSFTASAGFYQTGVTGALPASFTSAGRLETSQITKVLVGF